MSRSQRLLVLVNRYDVATYMALVPTPSEGPPESDVQRRAEQSYERSPIAPM